MQKSSKGGAKRGIHTKDPHGLKGEPTATDPEKRGD